MQPRLSIARLMAVVAIVAANLATARILWSSEPSRAILIGVAPTAVVLQITAGSFALRGANARFRVGFLVGGAVAMATFIWAMLTPEVLGFDPRTGTLHRTPGSPMYEIWMSYVGPVSEYLSPLLFDPRIDHDPEGDPAIIAFRSMILSMPQFVLGLLGGLLVWGMRGVFQGQVSFRRQRRSRAPRLDGIFPACLSGLGATNRPRPVFRARPGKTLVEDDQWHPNQRINSVLSSRLELAPRRTWSPASVPPLGSA